MYMCVYIYIHIDRCTMLLDASGSWPSLLSTLRKGLQGPRKETPPQNLYLIKLIVFSVNKLSCVCVCAFNKWLHLFAII